MDLLDYLTFTNEILIKKKTDFEGQKILVLPNKIVDTLENDSFTRDLFVTDIGYFPNAKYHHRERKEGILENILMFCVNGMD